VSQEITHLSVTGMTTPTLL